MKLFLLLYAAGLAALAGVILYDLARLRFGRRNRRRNSWRRWLAISPTWRRMK